MALAGVFITWSLPRTALLVRPLVPPASDSATLLYQSGVTCEAMATTTTSATSAPTDPAGIAAPLLSVACSAPIYFVVGPSAVPPTSPPATTPSARYYDPASGPLDVLVNAGDKFAWVLA